MALTDAKIRAIKPTEKVQKFSDEKGLQLWVSPTGGKVWNVAYRFLGKQKKLTIGSYPEIGLSEARKQRDNARALIAAGVDPAHQKKRDSEARALSRANTFQAIAAELLDKKRREGKASNTIGKREWLYGLAGDAFGKRPIAEITAPEVLQAIRVIESKGLLETARRMRSSIGEVFRFAVVTGRATNDPTFALRGALAKPIVRHRAAITDPKEFGALLRAIEGFAGQPTTIAALKLMALLFPRPGELRLAEWPEFDFAGALWTIPAARMKMRREHRVPLPRQAVAILTDLHAITGRGKLVFPGYGRASVAGRPATPRPISENTLNGALRRMGYTEQQMTAHGFRASASTLLNESGRFSADAIERALAHVESDDVRRAYARGQHWAERVQMAQWWADEVDRMRDGAKVLQLKKAE